GGLGLSEPHHFPRSRSDCGCCLREQDGRRRMRENTSPASHIELARLRQLTARIGADPLLTQASTGNSSTKLDGVLWIKASGKWMADAADQEMGQDILMPLDLAEVTADCLQQRVDPAD